MLLAQGRALRVNRSSSYSVLKGFTLQSFSIFFIDPVVIILFACSHLIRLASYIDRSICAKMYDHIVYQGRPSLLKRKSQIESRCRCIVLISLHLWI